jgi:hypothetical protein
MAIAIFVDQRVNLLGVACDNESHLVLSYEVFCVVFQWEDAGVKITTVFSVCEMGIPKEKKNSLRDRWWSGCTDRSRRCEVMDVLSNALDTR